MSLSDASHTLNIEGHGSLANMHTEGNNYELTVQCTTPRITCHGMREAWHGGGREVGGKGLGKA